MIRAMLAITELSEGVTIRANGYTLSPPPMTTRTPRIAVTLPPDVYDIITSLAQVQGVPRSRLVADIITQMGPPLARLSSILEAAKGAQSGVLEPMLDALNSIANDIDPYKDQLMDVLTAQAQKMGPNPRPCNTGVHSSTGRGSDA